MRLYLYLFYSQAVLYTQHYLCHCSMHMHYHNTVGFVTFIESAVFTCFYFYVLFVLCVCSFLMCLCFLNFGASDCVDIVRLINSHIIIIIAALCE